jgi:predicted Zn finger-like uncharacterized protein
MQFSCDSCKTQLQIADEKVRGKRLIVRCRRCGAKIALADPALPKSSPRVISGPDRVARPAAPSAAPVGGAAQPGGDGKGTDVEITRAMESEVLERALQASAVDAAPQNGAAAAAQAPVAAPADAAIWFAMLHGRQTGPLTRAELEARASEGEVGPRTYLWREGMDSWQRARDVAELGRTFPQFPGSLLPPATPAPTPPPKEAPTSPPAPAPQQTSALVRQPPPLAQTWQMGEGAMAEDLREPVPALPPDRVPADVARELFASGEHSISQKNAMDLARWATDELGRKKDHAAEHPRISPPVVPPAAQLFESTAPRRGKGTAIIFLGLAALAGTALVLWMLLSSSTELREEPAVQPAPQGQQQSAPAPPAPSPKPAETQPPPQPPVPAPQPAPAAMTGLTAEQVHRKLDESKPALQSCIDSAVRRDPKLHVGKIHVATTIAPTGQVTAVRIDKRSVEDSPLGACLKRATKSIAFPPFAGAAFEVDIPIAVTAGD